MATTAGPRSSRGRCATPASRSSTPGCTRRPSRSWPPRVQEDADAIGLSVLSGAHNYLFKRVLELLREKGAEDVAVFGGGIIPPEDIAALKAIGVKELFTPGHLDPGHRPLRPRAHPPRSEAGRDDEVCSRAGAVRRRGSARGFARVSEKAAVGLRARAFPVRSTRSSGQAAPWPTNPRFTAHDPAEGQGARSARGLRLTAEQQQSATSPGVRRGELATRSRPTTSARVPHDIVPSSARSGFLGVLVPEEYGGAGLDYVSYALIVEELNRGDASVGITMWAHNSLCTNHIAPFGSPAQKRTYLPRLAARRGAGRLGPHRAGLGLGRRRAAHARRAARRAVGPERQQGVHHQRLGGLDGRGDGAHRARRGSPGASPPSSLEKGTPGFSSGKPYRKLGLHASDTAELIFEDARVPAGNLIGERGTGFAQAMHGPRRRAHRDGGDGRRHRPGRGRPGRAST